MATKTELEERLVAVEAQIRETKQRLPAHSIKPPIMMELISLEDERDEILNQLRQLKESEE